MKKKQKFSEWSSSETTLVRVNAQLKKEMQEFALKGNQSMYFHINCAIVNYLKKIKKNTYGNETL